MDRSKTSSPSLSHLKSTRPAAPSATWLLSPKRFSILLLTVLLLFSFSSPASSLASARSLRDISRGTSSKRRRNLSAGGGRKKHGGHNKHKRQEEPKMDDLDAPKKS